MLATDDWTTQRPMRDRPRAQLLQLVEHVGERSLQAQPFLTSSAVTYGYSPYSKKLGTWCSHEPVGYGALSPMKRSYEYAPACVQFRQE